MEYTDIELNKMIAELEGLDSQIEMKDTKRAYVYSELLNIEYNPIYNWSLLGPLMVKYKVEVRHAIKVVAINYPGCKYEQISYESESEIPRAIIMCILTSENII